MSDGYRQRYRQPPSSVKVGEEHEVTVKEIGRRGNGIAKIQNFMSFPRRTKNGDKAKIRRNWVSLHCTTAEKELTESVLVV